MHGDAADCDWLVDGGGLDPPFAGDRADTLRPERIADAARMIDVAGAAVDDGADLAPAAAYCCGDTAEIGDLVDALHHQHVARLGEIEAHNLANMPTFGQ